MNSEELEKSLVTEFENYLKAFLAEMKQETTEFQGRIEAEFEKQKAQMDEAFRGFASRFDSERTFDAAFSGSVAEHLRLARDEGARVAANAMVEAESLGQSPLAAVPLATAPAKYDVIRAAVDDISSKDSQSAILKSLVQHAADFAPRGAFFIIKSDHFSGWKVFGADDAAESAIRDIHFPISSETILGAAVASKGSKEGASGDHSGDLAFLNPLQFGEPAKMHAIPLVARGRGVAVLYADRGVADGDVNQDALETLVRVAGLTVELLASSQTARAEDRVVAPADFENVEEPSVEPSAERTEFEPAAAYEESVPAFTPTADEPPAFAEPEKAPEEHPFAFSDSVTFETSPVPEVSSNPFEAEPPAFGSFESAPEPAVESYEPAPTAEMDNPFAAESYSQDVVAEPVVSSAPSWSDMESSPFGSEAPVETSEFVEPAAETAPPMPEPEVEESRSADMVFDSAPSFEEPVASPFDQPKEQFEPAGVVAGGGYAHQAPEPAVIEAPVVKAPQPRLSERNVDLPIEVPEEERRIHNDARRFARLLVSEIKLYNEKKVLEGRESSDLYDRLREAIDRSREMYDKRVQPPVAAKFDYFHYELVNSLAEGQSDRLGAGYPGASV